MPRTFAADSVASPDQVWSLMAEPERWHEWSPHVRGAIGLGSPEVRKGAVGVVRLLGVVPILAQILDKKPGRSWTWRVGPMILVHPVSPREEGCRVAVTIQAPGPLEALLAATYGPVVELMVSNLARVAASPS